MTEPTVLRVERHEHVEVWTLDRPEALNAFNRPLLLALNDELQRLEGTPGESLPRAVVIAGAGKAFSAGADLKERKSMPLDEVPGFVTLIGATFDRVARQAVPFIAAVAGFAFGGGMELALACDLRVVGPAAQLGLTEVRLAIIPGAGGTQRLPRLVGVGRAKDLILTGRRVGAEEAVRIGLAEHLDADPLGRALALAAEIASAGPVAVRAAKRALEGTVGMTLAEGLAFERGCYDSILSTQDRVEALVAFAERRPPSFQGR